MKWFKFCLCVNAGAFSSSSIIVFFSKFAEKYILLNMYPDGATKVESMSNDMCQNLTVIERLVSEL